jgi:NAD+ kinase
MFSQSSSSNPLVLPNEKDLKIKLKSSVEASIVVDGREDLEVYQGSEITISRNKNSYTLMHPLDYDYFEACRTKLSWGQPLINLDE